jgi:hypothetical protein
VSVPDTLKPQPASLRPGGLASSDLLIIDDVDVTDKSEIRAVVAEVEAFLEAEQGVRMSILTGEQWLDALSRSLSPGMRRGAERHIHILRDKGDPHHLLVSPSAVSGVNEGSRVIYAEVVYHVLRCIPTALSLPLRRGLDDLLAQWLGERLGVNLFTRNFPEESEMVMALLEVLSRQFGYQPLDWGRLMRRDPDKFFYALERSRFAGQWVVRAKGDTEVAPLIEGTDKKRPALVAALRAENLTSGSALVRLTREAAQAYLAAHPELVPVEKSVAKSEEKADKGKGGA